MPLRLTLRELEVFVAIAEQHSVTRAARAVALSQSAASQALAQLESAVGVSLFDRVGRGRALLDDAQALQDALLGGALSLRLGASTTIANYLLPQRLAALRRQQPDCRLSLHVANTRDIVAAVLACSVDFGLVEGPCQHPELEVIPWLDDELTLIAAPDHPLAHRPLSAAELADAPWLLREPGSGTREAVERALLPSLGRLRVEMELGDSEAIKRAVAAGLGVSCLSRRVAAELLTSGALVELRADLPVLTRTLWRIHRRDRPPGAGLLGVLTG
jgi:DNA-binding transcriptional LysR family regulator